MVATGVLAHVIHVGGDVTELNDWYRRVFDVEGFMGWPEPDYLPSERRLASMFMVGGLCIETMAPAKPVDDSTPLGRAYTRRGSHLYSMAFRVDDLAARGRHLLAEGVFIGAAGGARATDIAPDAHYFVPSPRDMSGVRVELLDVVLAGDPRRDPGWLASPGPLGLAGIDSLDLLVEDPVAAAATLGRLLGAVPLGRPGRVRFGDSVLQLTAGSPPGLAGITLAVDSAARARQVLAARGVNTVCIDADAVVVPPPDAHGARFTFREGIRSPRW